MQTESCRSHWCRFLHVYLAPEEVYEDLKMEKPRILNWLIPLIIGIVAGIVHFLYVFNQPAIIQQVKEQQEQQVLGMVKSSKIPDSQAEDALARLEKYSGPNFLKLSGSILATASLSFGLFIVALAIWIIGAKVYKAEFDYARALEITGMAIMIPALASLAGMLLMAAMGSQNVNFGPSLFIKEFNKSNALHSVLWNIDLMALWHVGVLSVGLARISNISFAKGFYWMGGLWCACKTVVVLAGQAMTGT